MPDSSTLALFVIAAITFNLSIGPNALYVMSRSVSQGRKAGIISAFGISVGSFVHTLAVALGLSALLMSSAKAYLVFKYACAAYLIYLGVRMLLRSESNEPFTIARPASLRQIWVQGIFTNVLNPETALFFFAFLPQFLDPSKGAVAWQIVTLGIILNVLSMVRNILVAVLTGSVGHLLKNRPSLSRVQQWFAGSVLVALGICVALPERS